MPATPQPQPDQHKTRPPLRWATHGQVIAFVVVAVLGGTMFGLAFAVWPQNTYERVIGSLILLGVLAGLAWVATYLRRPVADPAARPEPPRPAGPRKRGRSGHPGRR